MLIVASGNVEHNLRRRAQRSRPQGAPQAPFTGSFDVNRPMPNVRLEYLEVLAFGEHAHGDDSVTFRLGGEIAVRVRAGSRPPFGAPADARLGRELGRST